MLVSSLPVPVQQTEGSPYPRPMRSREAALYCGVSIHTLYHWSSQGQLPSHKPNGRVMYFSKADLDAFIFRNRNTPDYELAAIAKRVQK